MGDYFFGSVCLFDTHSFNIYIVVVARKSHKSTLPSTRLSPLWPLGYRGEIRVRSGVDLCLFRATTTLYKYIYIRTHFLTHTHTHVFQYITHKIFNIISCYKIYLRASTTCTLLRGSQLYMLLLHLTFSNFCFPGYTLISPPLNKPSKQHFFRVDCENTKKIVEIMYPWFHVPTIWS